VQSSRNARKGSDSRGRRDSVATGTKLFQDEIVRTALGPLSLFATRTTQMSGNGQVWLARWPVVGGRGAVFMLLLCLASRPNGS
jgi:hypothetical protein